MTEATRPALADAIRTVIAESNGHHWVKAFSLICCRDCGIVRRFDDKNKPCKGVVGVGPRDTNLYAAPASAVPGEHATREALDAVVKFVGKQEPDKCQTICSTDYWRSKNSAATPSPPSEKIGFKLARSPQMSAKSQRRFRSDAARKAAPQSAQIISVSRHLWR